MRSSIRRRILVPLVAIQVLTVAAITAAGITLAARRDERRNVARLTAVLNVLQRATFPLTPGVLSQMHGLSGAHFLVRDARGETTAVSQPELAEATLDLRRVPAYESSRFESWRDWPTFSIRGETYFGARLSAPASGGTGGSTLLTLYPESSWSAAIRDFAAAPIGLGLAAIALMVAVSGWIADRISGRLLRLREQVARIADGDFLEADPGADDDELRDLAGSVNQMSAQLRDSRQTIIEAERTQLLARLAAGFAHQLRNSLTGARLSVQLHAKRCAAVEGDSSLAVALRQLSLTEEQVRALLAVGRRETLTRRARDLGAMLADLETLLEPSRRHAKVELDREFPPEPLVTEIDEPTLRAAVLNLALNALEAAGPGGRTKLRLIGDEENVIIEVGDDGPGPPDDLKPSIFEPFVTSKPEGVGLGLAMAKRTAEAHRGSLSWRRDEGWTWFRLTLPRTVADAEGSGAEP